MDKGFVRVYNKNKCVGSSILERSHSCERCRCNSAPGAPFLMLDFYGVNAILLTHERASDKKSRNIRGHQIQAFYWRYILRPSQSRGRANHRRNQQKGDRTWQKIRHEAKAGIIPSAHALIMGAAI